MTAAGARSRIEGLDALRGVAVGLVMLRHALPEYFAGAGIVGVTMFFALSGFLITGLLDRDLKRFGAVRWGRFYAHRAFRLYPALLLLLAVYVTVEAIWSPLGNRDDLAATAIVGLTYTADLPIGVPLPGLSHLWSLAVEEQFYLVWPLLLFAAYRFRRNLSATIAVAFAMLTLAGWATLAIADQPADVYRYPTTWASAMALGGLASLHQDALRAWFGRSLPIVAVGAAVLLLGYAMVPHAKELWITYSAGPIAIAASTIVVVLLLSNWNKLPGIWLRPLLWLGTISYAVYLWNLPVTSWVHLFSSSMTATAATVPLTIIAATISWYTAEAVGRLLRRQFDARARDREKSLVTASI